MTNPAFAVELFDAEHTASERADRMFCVIQAVPRPFRLAPRIATPGESMP